MATLLSHMKSRDTPIEVVIVGIGSIGSCLVHQAQPTPGMVPVGIADIRLDVATGWAKKLGLPHEVVESVEAAKAAIERGVMAVTDDGNLLASLERVDVFIEATNAMEATARSVITALEMASTW